MARQQNERVVVPDDLDLAAGVPNVRAFLHRKMRVRCRRWRRWGWSRRAFGLNCESTTVFTDDGGEENECSLRDALAGVADRRAAGAEVVEIVTKIEAGNRGKATFTWQRGGPSEVQIGATDSTWAVGISEELGRYLRSGRYNDIDLEEPKQRGLRGWVKPVLIGALGTLLASAVAWFVVSVAGLFG